MFELPPVMKPDPNQPGKKIADFWETSQSKLLKDPKKLPEPQSGAICNWGRECTLVLKLGEDKQYVLFETERLITQSFMFITNENVIRTLVASLCVFER